MNYSSISTTTSPAVIAKTLPPDYSHSIADALLYCLTYALAPFIYFGLYDTLVSAIIFTVNNCNMPKNLRLFYILLSVCDFLTLIFYQLPAHLGRAYETYRQQNWTQISNITTCYVFRYIFTISGAVSSWSMLIFAVERAFVVSNPLKAASRNYSRYSAIAIAVVALTFIAFSVFNFWAYSLVTATTPPFRNCRRNASVAGMLANLVFIPRDLLPSALQLLCNSYLVYKVRVAVRTRDLMTKQQSAGSSKMAKELVSTVTLVAFSLLRLIVYLPSAVNWLIIALMVLMNASNSGTYTNIYNMGALLLALESCTLCLGFFVYMFMIPAFRRAYLKYFCFAWLCK